MTFSIKRMNAIFQKDLKDLSKNLYIGTSLMMPILLAVFYGRMGEKPIEMHYLIINLTLVAVGSFVQCAIIAEEKEKNTLRGLMLSPATLPEILSGKSLVSFILTCMTIVICAVLTGYEPANLILIAVAIIISSFFYLTLGTLFGLLSKSVVEASVVMMPAMFLFGFSSMLVEFIDEYPVLVFIKYFPNQQLIDFAIKVQDGQGLAHLWVHIGIILAWFVAVAVLTVIVFKKKELDE